jgi:subtilisin family serine protease
VAGTIAALDNGIGVVGVAPEARLWAVKVLDNVGNGSDETVVSGIDKVLAWKHDLGGEWIVSLSLGSADPSDIEKAAFQRLADNDILAVAAAGNRGLPGLDYPGGYSTVLAVAAVGSDQTLASFSSYGPNLAVVAPGVKVLSTVPRGSAITSGARVDAESWLTGYPFTGSPRTELHGTYIACGLGRDGDFPAAVRGKIALMLRGEIQFAEKVRNAVAAGAIGAIIYNYDDTEPQNWTLFRPDCSNPVQPCVPWADDVAFPWPPTIALTNSDGLALLAQSGSGVTIGTWMTDYKYLNGTSMATPHVSGIAALLWTLAPGAHANDIREAIVGTAHDLGPSGYDIQYGYGLVDAAAAAKRIAPSVVITPAPAPPPVPPRRRATH